VKRVMSVSLGSSTRDHSVELELLGEKILIERVGTNGDIEKAIQIIKDNDGIVNAFGLGGIDLYLFAGSKRYIIRDAERIARAARKTPIVDGSGLKNSLERNIVKYLENELGSVFGNKKVLMVSAVDRPGMAAAFHETGAEMIFGDLIFGLGIPISISSFSLFQKVARIIVPIAAKLPFKMLYPTGEKQEKVDPKYAKYYEQADIIAGDFHFIRRYMPEKLNGKWIITNTVTQNDIKLLKDRGVSLLVTTTPDLGGRSFGTNVMEGMLLALTSSMPGKSADNYCEILDKIGFKPRIIKFSEELIS
jgi:hypothetical protein